MKTSLLAVSQPLHVTIVPGRQGTEGVPCELAILDRAVPLLLDPHSLSTAAVDLAAAYRWVGARARDPHAKGRVGGNVAILDRPAATLLDADTLSATAVNLAAAHSRVRTRA